MENEPKPVDPWQACTFEGARDDVLRRGQKMTFREKVIWLEQAARLSMRFVVSSSQQAPEPPATVDATGGQDRGDAGG